MNERTMLDFRKGDAMTDKIDTLTERVQVVEDKVDHLTVRVCVEVVASHGTNTAPAHCSPSITSPSTLACKCGCP